MEYSAIDPVINRCFHTKRTALPERYYERVSFCYELEFIPWGEGAVITDGVELPATAGTVFFRRPNMRVHGILPYSSYGILMDTLPVTELPLVSRFSPTHTICFLFREIYASYLSNEPCEQLKMKANILNILYYLKSSQTLQGGQRNTPSAQYHLERLNHLTEYINGRLDQHLTLDELAKVCSLSPSLLCRLFKQTYNETIFSYIKDHRLQKAKGLLIETDLPIKDICLQCGFGNESYFYRTFKESVQITPTDFRRIHQQPFADFGS